MSEGKVAEKISGNDTEKKWSKLWYIFIPKNCEKTLAQMNDEERKNRKDDSTHSKQEFAKWYKNEN